LIIRPKIKAWKGFIAHQYSRLRLRPGPPTRFRVEGAALEDLDR
jgi:hypothetical protein